MGATSSIRSWPVSPVSPHETTEWGKCPFEYCTPFGSICMLPHVKKRVSFLCSLTTYAKFTGQSKVQRPDNVLQELKFNDVLEYQYQLPTSGWAIQHATYGLILPECRCCSPRDNVPKRCFPDNNLGQESGIVHLSALCQETRPNVLNRSFSRFKQAKSYLLMPALFSSPPKDTTKLSLH